MGARGNSIVMKIFTDPGDFSPQFGIELKPKLKAESKLEMG